MLIQIHDKTRTVLENDCVSRLPEEACGLLVGRATAEGVVITEAAPLANVSDQDRTAAFAFDPAAQFAFQRALRTRKPDEKIVGHYHSHPNGQALPSDLDRRMASDNRAVWLIVSIGENQVTDIRAFRPGPEGFQGLELAGIDVTPSSRGGLG